MMLTLYLFAGGFLSVEEGSDGFVVLFTVAAEEKYVFAIHDASFGSTGKDKEKQNQRYYTFHPCSQGGIW